MKYFYIKTPLKKKKKKSEVTLFSVTTYECLFVCFGLAKATQSFQIFIKNTWNNPKQKKNEIMKLIVRSSGIVMIHI